MRRSCFAVSILLSCLHMPIASTKARINAMDTTIFAPNTKPVAVFTNGTGLVCEGPVMAPDGRLLFTDVTTDNSGGLIWAYNPQTSQTSQLRAPSGNASGLAFDAAGSLLVAEGPNAGGGKCISRINMVSGHRTQLVKAYGGRPLNGPNDLVRGSQGRIYFTDSRYQSNEPLDQPWMGVYGLEPNGVIQLLAVDLTRPNGVALSPDQHTLYVGSYDGPGPGIYAALPDDYAGPQPQSGGQLVAYTIQADGRLVFKQQLAAFKGEGPDGLTVDAKGNLYAAVARRIIVYSPDGKRLAEMPMNVKTTNLCFGNGAYCHTLFITVEKGLYTLETLQVGLPPAFQPTSTK